MSRRGWLTPRWMKVWADLWGNPLRTALVVMSIAVGVFAVGMVYSAYLMFSRDLAGSWATAAPASATLYADPFDEELVQSVRSLRGVKEATGRRNVDVRVKTQDGQMRQMLLIALPDYVKQKVNIIKPQSGAWPPGDGDVLLERSSLAGMGIKQGDRVQVETSTGRKRSMKVSGVVYDPAQIPSMFSGRSYGYISMETLAKLDEERRLDEVNLVVQPELIKGQDGETAIQTIQGVGRRAWTKLEQGDTTVYWLQVGKPGEHPLQGPIDALVMLLAVLGGLSLLLGTLLLVNTVSAILAQQIRQVGIMKSIGAQRGQILRLYLSMVAAYGCLALLVSAPLGAVAANAITSFMAQAFNFNSGGLELPPRVLVLEACVALLVPLLAALWPIWQGTGVTVREAISDYGIGAVAAKGRVDRWVDRGLRRLHHLPRPVVLSLRNTFRRKGRLALTLITLVVAGTVFMAVFSVRSSLYATLDQALEYFQYDISINFTQNYRGSRISQEVMRVPGVEAAEAWGFSSGRILKGEGKAAETEASKSTFLLAPPVNTTMIQPRVIEGRWLVEEDENAFVVNTEVVKDNPQIKVGGETVIKVGDRKLHGTVVGIAQSQLTGPICYSPNEWMTNAIQAAGKARSVQVVTLSKEPQAQVALGQALEAHLKKNNLRVQSVEVTWQQKERLRSQFDIITTFLLVMAVLLAIVGALGLMGTMSINVLERTREIGVMRAIGASSLGIGKVFIVEALVMGLLSWLIALLLALPVSAALSYQVGMLFMRAPLQFSFSLSGLAIWLLLSVVLSVLASLLPAWNATRLSVRDVLSYE
ncbi:ABC transporter permease [Azotosporobacter soli]|uniref:ABC transporter permease n=1 Tax=Azotosporobacter soli TaxID=3055040 RepID=UPI0031FE6D4B